MPEREPTPLTPVPIDLDSPEFAAIAGWPFADPFVRRLLENDVPQRVRFNEGRVWVYRDPENQLVGFGTLDVCRDYGLYTGGQPHPYIPLLAANPAVPSRGYGTSIVRHLIDAAALRVQFGGCHGLLFLDVYEDNTRAIALYGKCRFATLTDEPIPDAAEHGKRYLVMARRVSVSRSP